MSQSGFEMFSNVAGMVIVIADVIFFYALWNIFCKNKKRVVDTTRIRIYFIEGVLFERC